MVLLASGLLAAGRARGQAAVGWTGIGRTVTLELSARQFDQVVARFDPTMAAVLSAAKLASTWDGLVGQVGAFRGVTATRQQEAQGYQIVFVTCQFDKTSLDVKIAFDAAQRIAGLFFVPTQTTTQRQTATSTQTPTRTEAEWMPPEYARAPPSSFTRDSSIFMPSSTSGAGLGSPADYERPGHVAAPVIADIAGWIATATPRQEDRR